MQRTLPFLLLLAVACDPAIDAASTQRGARTFVDGGADASAPAPGEKPTTGCGDIDYLGQCFGNVARWCEMGVLRETDCAARGETCAYLNAEVGNYCVDRASDAGVAPTPTPDAATSETAEGCGRPIETEELMLTNMARTSAGLTPYTCDDGLTRAARLHAQDMCDNNYFSHTSRDGRSHIDRIRAAGVEFDQGGENIAWGQQTPDEVHNTWMNSGGHRAAIMSSGFRRIGIGYVPCNGSPEWVQNFAD